jgi:DNA-binding NarL/FixJ family response regulator
MPNPMIRIHNIETNEVIDREMTDEELKQFEKENAEVMALKKIEADKVAARESALAKLIDLGLTEEEIAAL